MTNNEAAFDLELAVRQTVETAELSAKQEETLRKLAALVLADPKGAPKIIVSAAFASNSHESIGPLLNALALLGNASFFEIRDRAARMAETLDGRRLFVIGAARTFQFDAKSDESIPLECLERISSAANSAAIADQRWLWADDIAMLASFDACKKTHLAVMSSETATLKRSDAPTWAPPKEGSSWGFGFVLVSVLEQSRPADCALVLSHAMELVGSLPGVSPVFIAPAMEAAENLSLLTRDAAIRMTVAGAMQGLRPKDLCVCVSVCGSSEDGFETLFSVRTASDGSIVESFRVPCLGPDEGFEAALKSLSSVPGAADMVILKTSQDPSFQVCPKCNETAFPVPNKPEWTGAIASNANDPSHLHCVANPSGSQ